MNDEQILEQVKSNPGKSGTYHRVSGQSLFISTSFGFFIWGIVADLGPSSLSWPFLANISFRLELLLLICAPFGTLLGNVFIGVLADHIGRKKTFIITMMSYAAGILVVSISINYFLFIAGLFLAGLGVGGEEAPSLSLIAEDTTVKERSRNLTLAPNFNNAGSAFTAALLMVSPLIGIFEDRIFLLISAFAVILYLVYARFRMPESFRWLNIKGRREEATIISTDLGIQGTEMRIREPNRKFSFAILVAMGVSQYLTFGLMAFIIEPLEFGNADYLPISLVALIGATIAGFIAVPLIAKGRKNYTLFAYGGGFLTMLSILLLSGALENFLIFMPLLFVNMFFSEFAWASRTNLEPELFATQHRSTMIGLIRVFPMVAYIFSIFLTGGFGLEYTLAYNLGLWGLGLVAAIIWFARGTETRDISTDFLLERTSKGDHLE